ncbi:protein FAM8A1-like [Macrosteles quadrilineatus]|uniref:protein FAM8A1-like n=1 Tax=Macrosteles quadrilineatus TaxID=74068 RepID=UPI0023E13E69|nr:protein FAM8A1-like [Macrosteles quadrilineatus]XP_054268547.1 protein FAM8A1-like [Macrosteles quadrilineatus]
MTANKLQGNSESSKGSDKITTHEKYFADLEKWLHEAYMWQGVAASFPYFLMCNQYMSQFPSNTGNEHTGNVRNPFLHDPTGRNNAGFQQQQTRVTFSHGIECKIPALWKRLLAEFLDFLILFILKLAVTWIAIDFFEIIDLAKFDLDSLQVDMRRMDYRVALQVTHNIMILEVVHRVVVCIFETFWLVGGVAGRIGGATPGKSMMGLRVVRCENVTNLPGNDEIVVVYPGTDLGLGWAFARSFIKNLVLALFIPFIVAFYYFPFNRAGYDMICNTIVIEEPIVQHRPNNH